MAGAVQVHRNSFASAAGLPASIADEAGLPASIADEAGLPASIADEAGLPASIEEMKWRAQNQLTMRATLILLIAVASPAFAAPHLLEAGTIQFADYHPAAPVVSPPPVYRPVGVSPVVRHAEFDIFFLGLGLAAGGLVLGAGGFTVLYLCRTGTECNGDVSTAIGWILAAPGIIPLTVGLIMMYAASGNRGRVTAPSSSTQRWAFGVAPLRDGALFSAAARF